MDGYYENATICINGHTISEIKAKYDDYCFRCGKETISSCTNCSVPIRGLYVLPDVFGFGYTKPSYCFKCGIAFPWTQQLLNNAIELVALDEELSENDKEIIKNALPDLFIETPTTPVATAKFKKFIPKASSFVQDGLRTLLIDVVSETAKKSIWG